MKRIHLFSLCSFLLISIGLHAQNKTIYAQSLANPTYLFPELTGWHGGMQVNTGYRYQSQYLAYGVSTDAYVHALRSGIGIVSNKMTMGNGLTSLNTIDLNIAPKIKLGDKSVLMPAVSIEFGHETTDWSQNQFLCFPPAGPASNSVNYLSVGAGIALVRDETFFVVHSDNINRPDVSYFANSESRIPRTLQVLVGRNFKAGAFTITPNVSYQRYGPFVYLNFAANVQYKGFYIGSKYTLYNAAGFAAGYEIKQRVRLSYSYDMNVSRLGSQNHASHELALRVWLFKDRAKKQFLSNLPLM